MFYNFHAYKVGKLSLLLDFMNKNEMQEDPLFLTQFMTVTKSEHLSCHGY